MGGQQEYDLVELRQRMLGAFGSSDLRALAEHLSVPATEKWTRGADEIARDMIRHFESGQQLDYLLEALRTEKPLVEWPAAQPAFLDESFLAFDAAEQNDPMALDDAPTSVAGHEHITYVPTGTEAELPPLRAPVAPTIIDTASPRPPPPPPVRMRENTPLTDPHARETSSKGIEPRLLILVAGLTLGAAVVAFLAGQAWSGDDDAASSAATVESPGLAASIEGNGPAGRAARAFQRGLDTVTRVCELGEAASAGTEVVFRGAAARCGPGIVDVRRPRRSAPIGDPGDPADSAPEAPTNARVPGGGPALPGRDACITSCSQVHQGCKSGCGPEPTQSSQYPEFQACTGKCLTTYSKCRLRCR